ncbi:hypothetical protein [Nocardioides sp. P5_C9_2]
MSVTAFGAVGGNATLDTAAFRAAFDSGLGAVFVPEPPSGLAYEVNAPITLVYADSSKGLIGVGNGLVPINYSGTGYLLTSVSAAAADPSQGTTDVLVSGVKIDGGLNTVSDGAFHFDGGYSLNFDRVEVRRFSKVGAVGVDLLNCFSIDWARSNVLRVENGTGIRIGGSLQQVTNVHLQDFLLQRNAVGLDISTGITGGGLQLDNGAIRANDGSTAVRCTGKFANMTFGPALHVESETAIGTNATTGFKFSGASLFTSVVRFDGLDFSNVKTLLDLDGSAGTLRNVTLDNIYATALAGLAGTAFKLNNVGLRLKLGTYNVSADYTTVFNLTNTDLTDPIFVPATAFTAVGIGTPILSHQLRWTVQLLDPATSEIIAATVELPRNWNTYAIDAVWANVGAGTGAVVLRVDNTTRGNGETLATPPPPPPSPPRRGRRTSWSPQP